MNRPDVAPRMAMRSFTGAAGLGSKDRIDGDDGGLDPIKLAGVPGGADAVAALAKKLAATGDDCLAVATEDSSSAASDVVPARGAAPTPAQSRPQGQAQVVQGGRTQSRVPIPAFKVLRSLPGYSAGDPLRSEDDSFFCGHTFSLLDPSLTPETHMARRTAVEKMRDELRVGDCAFVLRSGGSYTYALYEGRAKDWDGTGMSFAVDLRGHFKVVRASEFWRRIKVPALPLIGDPDHNAMLGVSSGDEEKKGEESDVEKQNPAKDFLNRFKISWTKEGGAANDNNGATMTKAMSVDQLGRHQREQARAQQLQTDVQRHQQNLFRLRRPPPPPSSQGAKENGANSGLTLDQRLQVDLLSRREPEKAAAGIPRTGSVGRELHTNVVSRAALSRMADGSKPTATPASAGGGKKLSLEERLQAKIAAKQAAAANQKNEQQQQQNDVDGAGGMRRAESVGGRLHFGNPLASRMAGGGGGDGDAAFGGLAGSGSDQQLQLSMQERLQAKIAAKQGAAANRQSEQHQQQLQNDAGGMRRVGSVGGRLRSGDPPASRMAGGGDVNAAFGGLAGSGSSSAGLTLDQRLQLGMLSRQNPEKTSSVGIRRTGSVDSRLHSNLVSRLAMSSETVGPGGTARRDEEPSDDAGDGSMANAEFDLQPGVRSDGSARMLRGPAARAAGGDPGAAMARSVSVDQMGLRSQYQQRMRLMEASMEGNVPRSGVAGLPLSRDPSSSTGGQAAVNPAAKKEEKKGDALADLMRMGSQAAEKEGKRGDALADFMRMGSQAAVNPAAKKEGKTGDALADFMRMGTKFTFDTKKGPGTIAPASGGARGTPSPGAAAGIMGGAGARGMMSMQDLGRMAPRAPNNVLPGAAPGAGSSGNAAWAAVTGSNNSAGIPGPAGTPSVPGLRLATGAMGGRTVGVASTSNLVGMALGPKVTSMAEMRRMDTRTTLDSVPESDEAKKEPRSADPFVLRRHSSGGPTAAPPKPPAEGGGLMPRNVTLHRLDDRGEGEVLDPFGGSAPNASWEVASGGVAGPAGPVPPSRRHSTGSPDEPPLSAGRAYRPGDPAREEDVQSETSAAIAVSRLAPGDGAFVRRSNGSWVYGEVKERGTWSVTFEVDRIGSTKTIDLLAASRHVRVLRDGGASGGGAASAELGDSMVADRGSVASREEEEEDRASQPPSSLRRTSSSQGLNLQNVPRPPSTHTSLSDGAKSSSGRRRASLGGYGAANARGRGLYLRRWHSGDAKPAADPKQPIPKPKPSSPAAEVPMVECKTEDGGTKMVPRYPVGMVVNYVKADEVVISARILESHLDDLLEPYYTVLLDDGREKQTDNAHLRL